ncbi:hypothetical protein KIL84_003919 [Mauremys mutica]|uniref:Uncharacterized protein n=1 Tax=Mauremys mutica TaxID=74926 RepID=A0A9D4ATZ2_9SAUR|nr:hypothetical protein KIL84_003919 [Mauremys mutica]
MILPLSSPLIPPSLSTVSLLLNHVIYKSINNHNGEKAANLPICTQFQPIRKKSRSGLANTWGSRERERESEHWALSTGPCTRSEASIKGCEREEAWPWQHKNILDIYVNIFQLVQIHPNQIQDKMV